MSMRNIVARRLLMGALCLAIVGGVSLGAARGTTLASSPAKHQRALTNVYFILNWLPNVEFAGLWIPEKFHWWEQAGLHLSFKPWAVGVNPETDVPAKGGNSFGFQAGAAIAIAAAQKVPIQALYTDTQRSVFGLTVLASSKIHKLTDLRGKKVGYQPHELYVPETMLSSVGLAAGRDYRTVPVSFDISQLTSGNVDAYETFLTNEPIALQLQGVATRSFRAADYKYHFYDDVLFTSTSLINSNPALVRKVTSIVAKGFRWAHNHPQLAAQYTVAHYFPAAAAGKGVSASQNLQQQTLELKAFAPFSRDAKGQFSGLMTASYWQDSINVLYRYKLIKTKPDPSSVFTNQFNPYR
jgi:ABC-type nitrate/sulfonate/bicarbonate transport system substrate-binding protein